MSVAGLSFETATSRMDLLGADLLVAEAIFARTEVRFSVRTAARLGGICISEQGEGGASIWGNLYSDSWQVVSSRSIWMQRRWHCYTVFTSLIFLSKAPSAHYIIMTYPRIQSVSAFTLVPGRGISVWDFGPRKLPNWMQQIRSSRHEKSVIHDRLHLLSLSLLFRRFLLFSLVHSRYLG